MASSSSSSSFPKISVCLLLLVFYSTFSSAASRLSSLPKLQAQKLIRELNLFPKDSISIRVDDPLFAPGKIVEKKFTFPNLGGASAPSVEEFGHHAGYFSLPNHKAARIFYLFFESRNSSKDDPVVIWLTGGPGCSSELALFYENGPFQITNNLSLVWNDYGWDKVSNILYIDQPVGTGFSYTSNESDIPHDEVGVSNDLYDFLQAFFKEHPQLVKNDFYITGESYAGHYIPALASRLHQANKAKQGIPINLKGFAIGNGLTNPGIQYPAYTEYALDMKLITKADYDSINKSIPPCVNSIKECDKAGGDACGTSYGICSSIFYQILNVAGNINYYDIRKQCDGDLCYDFSKVEKFLNEKTVKDALGVGDLDFVSCSTAVYDAMSNDWMKNYEVGIPALLEDGIRLLIYAGEYDLICNWLGNSRWVHAMEWSGRKEFGASPTVPFIVDGTEAGSLKSHGPLTFLKVHNAGHLVPMDQPKAALQMLRSWLHGDLTMTKRGHNISPK